MKSWLLLVCLVICYALTAQQQISGAKGANPIKDVNLEHSYNQTYAIVVGISDYQDPSIPDLKYADKDAEAFANFLRSKAGGGLDKDHLKVLVNKEATVAQFAMSLDWLIEVVKENDRVILYFSGHGDVEKKTIAQPGYLLCWDAPSKVYLAGGALALPMFQDIITTLSSQNKAKVIVITDACRSGKLAGSSVGGSQITGVNLARQFANETKILSCQPNEYSIEGEQWGGGRGAFSFNLVNALYGMADQNNDHFVTLQEIGRYLEDHVSAEVAPVSQLPMVIGNRTDRLSDVNVQLLADLLTGKTNQMKMFSPVNMRGMEDEVLALVDSSTQELYRVFKKALEDKSFLEPSNACADAYFEKLMAEPKLSRLHTTLTRNYAAALQDDAQQWLVRFLQDPRFGQRKGKSVFDIIRPYPKYLNRAAELLGENHYMYPVLRARQHFFESKLVAPLSLGPDTLLGNLALKELRTSLLWQPDQAHVFLRIGQVFQYMFVESDSAEYYFVKAAELAPAWVLPLTQLANLSFSQKNQPDRARYFLEQATIVDSNAVDVAYWWAQYFEHQKDFDKMTLYYKKAFSIDPENAQLRTELGMNYMERGLYDLACEQLKEAVLLDSLDKEPLLALGQAFEGLNQLESAEKCYISSLRLDTSQWMPHFRLGVLYTTLHKLDKAEGEYLNAVRILPEEPANYYNLACLKANQKQTISALHYLEEALKHGFSDYDWVTKDEDLAPLRALPEWKALMKKYFPDQIKD